MRGREREGGREGRREREGGREGGRDREGGREGRAFTVTAVTVAAAACSAPQQPAQRSRHAVPSRSSTMSFGLGRPGPRARLNSEARRLSNSAQGARDRNSGARPCVHERARAYGSAHGHGRIGPFL